MTGVALPHPAQLRSGRLGGLGLASGMALTALVLGLPVAWEVRPGLASLPADGSATTGLHIGARDLLGIRLPWSGLRSASVDGARCTTPLDCVLPSTRQPGAQRLEVELRGLLTTHRATVELERRPVTGDVDGDGLPDGYRLDDQADRVAFRRWFAAIAASQARTLDPRWGEANRDCAGLLRFAFTQALMRHDAAWLARMRWLEDVPGRDVAAFHFPELPAVGARPFRIAPGPFNPALPLDGQFSASADGRWLRQANTFLLGREPSVAEPGDLLFFEDRDAPGALNHHAMVLVGGPEGLRVAYHTGPDGHGGAGEMRLLPLAALQAHPDEGWRPLPSNPRFLGFFRWKVAP